VTADFGPDEDRALLANDLSGIRQMMSAAHMFANENLDFLPFPDWVPTRPGRTIGLCTGTCRMARARRQGRCAPALERGEPATQEQVRKRGRRGAGKFGYGFGFHGEGVEMVLAGVGGQEHPAPESKRGGAE